MAIEIERKFLLASEGWREQVRQSLPMIQAYLGGDGCSVRVRVSGDQAWLNIKSAVAGTTRQEFEYPIPLGDAQQLIALAGGPSIDKTRHLIDVDGWIWEIDEFHGRNHGLVVAEIELPDAQAAFARPEWLGDEVTDDRRYYNNALASAPFDSWEAA